MNLHTPYPYWLMRHGIINSYASLEEDVKADVAIMGMGISGALVAWQLCQAGYSVVVVDKRHPGTGSTAASTALLQYEIDTPLHKLAEMIGEKNAVTSYQRCLQSISDLDGLCRKLNKEGLFVAKPSLQFASYKSHVRDLEKEFKMRKKYGIRVQWLDRNDMKEKFGFDRDAGILSKDGAQADAYRITHLLLEKCFNKGARLYNNTEVSDIRHHRRSVELITLDKRKIHAKKLVIACGYESQKYISRKVQDLDSTFAITSEPFSGQHFWHRNALIWETAKPYLYLRTTSDDRILVGGKDLPFSSPVKRDLALPSKVKGLERSFSKLFPHIPFKTDFKWAGVFASTKDGLPYIGSIPERPNTYFALGFGGNGITFSMIAAQMITGMIAGKRESTGDIFSFDR
ncbi:MAG TPA: FAD-dependent oxidoreductase [Chitinophagaceae bacterium]|nr:FAD-dependent oxidoreductase [Chitinophagaceae bacterium]